MIREIVVICKALSDENRIRILEMLRCGEKCACKLLAPNDPAADCGCEEYCLILLGECAIIQLLARRQVIRWK